MRILLVEDDEIDQMAFERLFKEYPYKFSIVSTLQEAKNLIQSQSFDVIISDYRLPDGTGLDILDISHDIPVIFTTGTTQEEVAIQALKKGVAEYLIKDLNRNYLKALPRLIEESILRKKFEHLTLMLTSVIKSIYHGVLVTDKLKRISFVNQAFCTLFGFNPDDLIDKNESDVNEVMEPRISDRVKLDDATTEFTYHFPGGKIIQFSATRTNVENEEHRIIATVTLYRDISKHMEMEEQLRKKVEELAKARAELEQLEMFSFVSTHDLKEPLHKIMTLVNLIASDPDTAVSEAIKDYRISLNKTVEEMWQMITQLHDYSKILSEGEAFTDVDLNRVFEKVCDKLILTIDETKAIIEVPHLPIINADPLQVQTVFFNLIKNALVFRNKTVPPKITVSFSETESSIKISVEDNGIGIDEKFFPQLFKPFQRLHTLEEYPGRGLGLAICNRVMQRHSGTITLKSAVGKGSTFTVTFPKKTS